MNPPANLSSFNGSPRELAAVISIRPSLVVVDFWAKWCPPCVKIGELLPTIAFENPKVIFLKVDVDQNRELQTNYQINSIPHFKFFKGTPDGAVQELGAVIGADVAQIKAKISQLT
jgi:thiol-disulfide isomerase/thioredoxin